MDLDSWTARVSLNTFLVIFLWNFSLSRVTLKRCEDQSSNPSAKFVVGLKPYYTLRVFVIEYRNTAVAGGCTSWLVTLLVEALAVRIGQEVVKRLTGGPLRNLLAAWLARI